MQAEDDEDTALTPDLTRTSSASELAELPISTTEESKNGFQRQNSWALPSVSALHSTAQVLHVWDMRAAVCSFMLSPVSACQRRQYQLHSVSDLYRWQYMSGAEVTCIS